MSFQRWCLFPHKNHKLLWPERLFDSLARTGMTRCPHHFFPLNFRHLIKQRIRLNFLICDSEDGNLWPSSALPKLKCPSARLHDNDALGGSSSEARIHEMRNLMETSSLPASDNSLTLHIDTTSSFFSPRFISHSGDKAFQGTRKAQKNADRRNEAKATTQWIQ